MTTKRQGAPVEGEREARLRAALQSNIARRKAQAHARGRADEQPHADARQGEGVGDHRGDAPTDRAR